MRFHQRITFTGTLDVDAEGLDWKTAKQAVIDALTDADEAQYFRIIRITKLEIPEGD